jgi:hypothetical protein
MLSVQSYRVLVLAVSLMATGLGTVKGEAAQGGRGGGAGSGSSGSGGASSGNSGGGRGGGGDSSINSVADREAMTIVDATEVPLRRHSKAPVILNWFQDNGTCRLAWIADDAGEFVLVRRCDDY